MRIRADEIPESGRTLKFHWGEEKLSGFVPLGDPFNPRLLRPVNVVLNLSRRPDHIRITGSIEGVLEVACHRCLRPFVLPLKEAVDIYMVADERMPRDEEKELEPDELFYEFFDGEVIELDRLVAEQIFLALPVKLLCSDECKGICPGCGVNLNKESCRCEERSRQSPFEKLKSLKPGAREPTE